VSGVQDGKACGELTEILLLLFISRLLRLDVGDAERQLTEAREENETAMAAVKEEMNGRIDQVERSLVEQSKKRRVTDELTKKKYLAMIDDIQKIQVQQTIKREDEVRLCKGRLEVLEHDEVKAGERAQLQLFEILRRLRRELQLETEARVTEEQKVTGTLEEYAVALQQGLLIVNRNDYQ